MTNTEKRGDEKIITRLLRKKIIAWIVVICMIIIGLFKVLEALKGTSDLIFPVVDSENKEIYSNENLQEEGKKENSNKSSPKKTKKREIKESALVICFNDSTQKVLSGYNAKFDGYDVTLRTDDLGCINVPMQIIQNERKISSYMIKTRLKSGQKISKPIQIGLTESSEYNVKF